MSNSDLGGNQQTVYSLSTQGVTFALTVKNYESVCGYQVITTEHPKLVIFETSKDTSFATSDMLNVTTLKEIWKCCRPRVCHSAPYRVRASGLTVCVDRALLWNRHGTNSERRHTARANAGTSRDKRSAFGIATIPNVAA